MNRAKRLLGPAVSLSAVGAATLALHLRDPHAPGSWGLCPTLAVFGIYCPGCGGLRAVNDLTNLDVMSAVSSNLLLIVAIPLWVSFMIGWIRAAWRGVDFLPRWLADARFYQAWVGLMIAYTVLRNLPGMSVLTP